MLPDDGSHQLACRALDLAEQERDDADRFRWFRGRLSWREHIRGSQLGVLIQNLPLEPLECRAGFDPEFLDEHAARLLERVEGIRLPPRPVQREHELRAQALTQRVLGDEAFELGYDLVVSARLELRLDTFLDHRQTERFEPARLLACERLVAKLGQRLATEERKRLPELLRPGPGTVSRRRCRDRLDALDIELVLLG